MTGTLSVWDQANRATVTFLRGHVIHAESTLEADRIGEILVRTHRITRAQLDRAASVQQRQDSGSRLGHILRDMLVVSEEDLAMAVQIQILEVMSRLILWSRGRWQFEFDRTDPGDNLPGGAMSVEEILSGQIILLDNLEPLYDHNTLLDEVYRLMPGPQRNNERVVLEGHEWAVLTAVDGRRTVREIAAESGLDAEQAAGVIADLSAARLIARTIAPTPDTPLLENVLESAKAVSPGTSNRENATGSPNTPPMPGAPLLSTSAMTGESTVVDAALIGKLNEVLAVLLARAEAREVGLISSSGSFITYQGNPVHQRYPALAALAASIFASWQELGRVMGESKASTMLYQGADLNICITPVGGRAILMTLYSQGSGSGLVNFWSREAGGRIARLLGNSGSDAIPASRAGGPVPAPPEPPPISAPTVPALDSEFQSEMNRQLDDLFRPRK
jgi:predicted regulator of Ras-like GTPase activity (Roadblock/LC7/MglB family)